MNARAPARPGALVLGGDVGALGVVRSLGRRKICVWTLIAETTLAGLSRYSSRACRWPESSDDETRVNFLLDLCKRDGLDGWALFAIGDENARFLACNYDSLVKQFRVLTPAWDILRWAYDKRLTYSLAEKLDVSYPTTFYPRTSSDVGALECSFPVILKPAYKPVLNRFTHDKAWCAQDRGELIRRYEQASRLLDPSLILVQELIPGTGESQFSYAGLFQDGRAYASVAARRLRQYPVDFGWCSTFVETVRACETRVAAEALLRAMHYSGLAEVEFKFDNRDGKYKLLEINPRIWWWHSLAIRAGVDLPYLAWRWAQNEPIETVHARPGVKWVRMLRDITAGATEIWRGQLSIRGYMRSLRGVSEFAVMAKDDPVPGLLEPFLWLTKTLHANRNRPDRACERDELAL